MSKFTDRLATKGIVVMDPTKSINLPYDPTTTGQGLWSQLTSTTPPYTSTTFEDPFETRLKEMENQMQLVQLELKLSRLKILSLEGKFTQEETANIRKMLMSEDEASRTVANSIIENA
jgi:hypothetical protein